MKYFLLDQLIGPMIRHTATAVGGWMMAEGIGDEAAIQQIVGGLTAAGGLLWSYWEKMNRD